MRIIMKATVITNNIEAMSELTGRVVFFTGERAKVEGNKFVMEMAVGTIDFIVKEVSDLYPDELITVELGPYTYTYRDGLRELTT